jgi:ADP-ribose pyrophosphatase
VTLGRRLSSRRVYEGRIFSVDVDEVEEPGGVRAMREVTRHRGSVGILALTDADDVVLVRQYRHPVESLVWEIPAGRLDPGEVPEHAARRELEEEVGLSAQRLEPLAVYLTSPGFCDEVMHLFRAEDLTPVPPRPDPDERIEVARFPFAAALTMLRRGELREAKTLLALLLESERRRSTP